MHSFMLPVQFLDKALDMPVVGTTTGAWFDGAENCGCSAVAFHRRSSTIRFVPQRQNLMVQAFQQTTEFPQLLFDGEVPAVLVVQFLRCRRGEDRDSSFVGRPSCSASWPVWLFSTVMPRHSCAWLVLLVTMQLALCSVRRLRRLPEDFTLFST